MFTFIAILAVGVVIYAVYYNAVTTSKNAQTVSGALYKPLSTYEEKKHFLHSITGFPITSKDLLFSSMDKATGILAEYPNDEAICDSFLNYAKKNFSFPHNRQQREALYKSVSSKLARSTTDLKPTSRMFFLELARWHYANLRQDKRLTSYDEQAIQNDIVTLFGK